MNSDFRRIIAVFILGCTSLSALNLNNLKTDDLNLIYYSQAHAYLVPHLVRAYTNTMVFDQDFWDWDLSEPVTIFVDDFSDWGNGGATAVPRNFVYVSLSPYMYVFEVAPAIDRISLLMHHELTHVIMMDKASPGEKRFRAILGGKIRENRDHPVSIFYAYLTTPRKFSPRWYHEGMAVFMETWLSGGIGRALGSYDEMVFRSMIRDSVPLYHAIGLEAEGTAIDFQVGANSYLYGTRFFNYLAYTYSPEKLKAWINRTPDSRKYYTSSFRHVFELTLNEAWNDWIRFEKTWQEENLKLIGANPLTSFRSVTDAGLGSVSRSFYDPDRQIIYTAVKFPGQIAQLLTIDTKTGKTAKLCHIRGASTYFTSSLAWDRAGEKLFFTTDNFTYRDLNMIDLKNKKVKLLINNLRAGDLAFNRVSGYLWAVRHENGISTLISIPPPYTDWQAVYAFPFGTDIYDLDISPDGSQLSAALTHLSGEQELVIFSMSDLETGKIDYYPVFDFDYSSPANFVFSEDGRFLYGTSYYSGVSNVFKYDLESTEMSVISNCETGFFRPVPVSDDSLLVFRYTGGKGFIPGWIPNRAAENINAINYLGQKVNEKHPVVREWYYGVTPNYDIDSLIIYNGRYTSLANFHNIGAYPVIEGFQDRIALGYYLEYANDIGYDKIDLTLGYEPFTDSLAVEDKLHARLNYQYRNWG
ncbi:MAG: hypothetical protein JW784_01880, partial [Candidatus Cloacimonetes bacterium]|nr:hypothetical protein [Candidatus Cloacimonadota bacterium]